MMAPLELTGLTKVFSTPAGPFVAVKDVNAEVAAGEFVAILGHSGCGKSTVLSILAGLNQASFGGVVIDGKAWSGRQDIAGEWGHNEMPSRTEPGLPDTRCYCGRHRCIETFVSGPGLAADHRRHATPGASATLDAAAIAILARSGDADAVATMARFYERLAAALATVINVLDPDVVVLGGGLSNIEPLCDEVGARLPAHVFSDAVATPVVRNRHGDSSGVRGAAWLWPP